MRSRQIVSDYDDRGRPQRLNLINNTRCQFYDILYCWSRRVRPMQYNLKITSVPLGSCVCIYKWCNAHTNGELTYYCAAVCNNNGNGSRFLCRKEH